MIQRLSVRCKGKDNLDGILEALEAMGFPENAIRQFVNSAGMVNVHAYRDGDIDKKKRLFPEKMEEYCVKIWAKIGYAEVTLTQYDEVDGGPVVFGKTQFDEWELG